MQWIAAMRDWWRRNGDWAKFLFPTFIAIVGVATNFSFFLAHMTMLIAGGLALVALMVVIDRALAAGLSGRR